MIHSKVGGLLGVAVGVGAAGASGQTPAEKPVDPNEIREIALITGVTLPKPEAKPEQCTHPAISLERPDEANKAFAALIPGFPKLGLRAEDLADLIYKKSPDTLKATLSNPDMVVVYRAGSQALPLEEPIGLTEEISRNLRELERKNNIVASALIGPLSEKNSFIYVGLQNEVVNGQEVPHIRAQVIQSGVLSLGGCVTRLEDLDGVVLHVVRELQTLLDGGTIFKEHEVSCVPRSRSILGLPYIHVSNVKPGEPVQAPDPVQNQNGLPSGWSIRSNVQTGSVSGDNVFIGRVIIDGRDVTPKR